MLETELELNNLAHNLDDLPKWPIGRWSTKNAQGRFVDIVSYLIKKGITVVLDEFHNVKNTGI